MYNFKELDDYFADCLNKFNTNCLCVLVAHNGRPVYDMYKADTTISEYSKFSEYTRFNIGSLSEIYIGILILKLIEEGEITSDDYVKNYIPEFPVEDIKIINLLTSAFADFYSNPETKNQQEFFNELYSVMDKKEYNKYSYAVLTDLIQRVTQKSIDDFAAEVIFEPLSLTRTSMSVEKAKNENIVYPYNSNTKSFIECTNIPAIGCDGCFVAPIELLYMVNIFQDFFHNRQRKVLKDATFKYALTPAYYDKDTVNLKTPIFNSRGLIDSYDCFGDLSSVHTFGKTGNTGCMVSVDLDNDVSIVIISNNTCFDTEKQKFKKLLIR